jgi:hypothetical protein
MKKLIIALFLINSLFAQVEFDLSGYVVNLPTYQKPQKTLADIFGLDQNTFLDLTRIRLRSEIYILSNTRLNIDYEISALYFNSLTTLSLGNASNNRQAAPLKWNLINEKNFTVDHYFDRLYLKQRFNFGEVEDKE